MSSVPPPPPPPGGDRPYGSGEPSYGSGEPSYGSTPPPYDPNQPAYGQGSFGPPPGYGPPPGGGGGGGGQETNGLAITSLVLGIVGLPLVCCWIGGLMSIAAAITGQMAKKKADQSHGRVGGRGMAQAGFILGIIGTVLFIALIIWTIYLVSTGEDFNFQYGTELN